MTDWTKEEDEAFNKVEKQSNLGKQILKDIQGQPYHLEALAQPEQKPVNINCPSCLHSFAVLPVAQRTWVGLTNKEANQILSNDEMNLIQKLCVIEAKLKEKNA